MQPKRLIIRCPNWIGDHVMAMEFYAAIREHYPATQVTWLMRKSLESLPLYGLADKKIVLPEVARTIGMPFWNFARELRESDFDLSVSLPATLSSALLFSLARIPERSGFSADGNAIFYTSHLKWKGRDSKKHKSEIYRELAEFLCGHGVGRMPWQTSPLKTKKVVIAPGASISLREWPYFEALLEGLLESYSDYAFTFVGAIESEKWHSVLAKRKSERVTDLIEKTNLEQLVEECRTASLVIANDSGVAHLAATLAGAKTLVLFGPGDPTYIAPRGNVLGIRDEGLSCSPCEKPYCHSPHGYQACLKAISSLKVIAAVNQALR